MNFIAVHYWADCERAKERKVKPEPLEVTRVVEIAEMGTIVFFRQEPEPRWPQLGHLVRITVPGGISFDVKAEVELAQSPAFGEVMILIFPDVKQHQVVVGSRIEMLQTMM